MADQVEQSERQDGEGRPAVVDVPKAFMNPPGDAVELQVAPFMRLLGMWLATLLGSWIMFNAG